MKFKIGHSQDLHVLVEGRDLILGGVKIEHDKGLKGHSDADVLIHAITESLIGAMGKGDLGTFFPDTDDAYKGVESTKLLARINDILKDEGYEISNIDSIIYAQQPKIKPHTEKMKLIISEILNIELEQINIKATTGEKVGVIGKEEAIAAESICLIIKK